MNEQRFVVSDILWRRLEPHLPGKVGDAGVSAKDNRLFLEAVFWRVRTGSPWRDLPPAFGRWNSQFRRFRRWAKAGVFDNLFNAMSKDSDLEYSPLQMPIKSVRTCARSRSANTPGTKSERPISSFLGALKLAQRSLLVNR